MNRPHSFAAAALCAAAFFLPATVLAQETPLTARALIAPTVGQSVFGETAVTRTAMRYELGAGAAVGGFDAELAFGFTHFLGARPDAAATVVLADLAVGGSYLLAAYGPFSVLPRVEVVLPTSKYSRDLSMFFASHVGLDGVLQKGPLRVTARARLRRDAHGSAVPPVVVRRGEVSDPDPGPFGFRTAGSRLIGREDSTRGAFRAPPGVVVIGFPNTAWGTHLGIDVEGTIAWGLYADLGFGWTHTWSYRIERPDNVIRGPTQPDRLQLNTNTGTLGVGWRRQAGPVELGVRAGIATSGPSRSLDGQRRFPWWNFEDANTDDSVLDLRLTARY